MFVVIFSVLGVVGVLSFIFMMFGQGDVGYHVFLLALLGYLIGCILAVYFFVSNLHKLAKSRVTSTQILSISPKGIELDQQQQRLSDLSSKYMMLFGFAMTSTILFIILGLCVPLQLRFNIFILDLTVNLWCIYLQFSFVSDHYRMCCGWCDGKL